jgi:hypothetical protein
MIYRCSRSHIFISLTFNCLISAKNDGLLVQYLKDACDKKTHFSPPQAAAYSGFFLFASKTQVLESNYVRYVTQLTRDIAPFLALFQSLIHPFTDEAQ